MQFGLTLFGPQKRFLYFRSSGHTYLFTHFQTVAEGVGVFVVVVNPAQFSCRTGSPNTGVTGVESRVDDQLLVEDKAGIVDS